MITRNKFQRNFLIILMSSILLGCNSLPNADRLPDLSLFNVNEGKLMNTTDIKTGNPFVVIYFDPDCGHCQDMTRNYLDSIAYFGSTNFYYVSDSEMERLKVFNRYFKFSQFPSITLFKDVESGMRKFIKPHTSPCVVLFDDSREMQVIYDGGIDAAKLSNEISKLL